MSDLEPQEFMLTHGERANPLWLKLKEHLESKLHNMRGKLEGVQPEQETARLRGHIQCLKGLIALGTDVPPQDGQ